MLLFELFKFHSIRWFQFFFPTSSQLVLNMVPPDSTNNLFIAFFIATRICLLKQLFQGGISFGLFIKKDEGNAKTEQVCPSYIASNVLHVPPTFFVNFISILDFNFLCRKFSGTISSLRFRARLYSPLSVRTTEIDTSHLITMLLLYFYLILPPSLPSSLPLSLSLSLNLSSLFMMVVIQ